MFLLIKFFYHILVFQSAGACESCWKRKKKCHHPTGSLACSLCLKLELTCVPHISRQEKRTDLKREARNNEQWTNISNIAGKDLSMFSGESDVFPDPSALVNSTATKDPILKHGNNVDDESNDLLSLKIYHDLKLDTVLTRLDTHSSGRPLLFEVADSNELICKEVDHRFLLDMDGTVTWITATSLPSMKNGGNGKTCAYREKGGMWRMGFVSHLFYLQKLGADGILHVYTWTGPVTSNGIPAYINMTSWHEIKSHFTFSVFDLDEIEFLFLNQVRGLTLCQVSLLDTRNKSDMGVQCKSSGPDDSPPGIHIPMKFVSNANFNFNQNLISANSIRV